MSSVRLQAVILLAVYTAVMIALARSGQRRTRDFSDFAVGGRSLGGVLLGLSFFATYASTTALIALRPPGGIVELTSFSGAVYGACFLPAVVLGLYWRRGDGRAVLTSFSMGLSVLLLWRLSPLSMHLHEVFPAIALSVLGYVAVAWYDESSTHTDQEEVE